ncbi:hypothetical protein GB882_01295 [Georgenia ruanii]|uniref:SIR2-like domain-containing protein n=2 Tax=Georgenia ruanii TaxID=348442 RepID=A0A7J9URP2_9MICO|nr:hypothetical protein [Georgenia ruanii]
MLATSMHAQPGVYAVLLGSGVSTGAGVPTGWGVVQDLVRRAAAAAAPGDSGSLQQAQEDPEAWWADHGEGDLGYASLLQTLAPTAAARQGLLARFFEPSNEDRDAGIKVPSRAHHAIAQLVKRGLVRVILTTNFDRLMEQALDAAGIAPQVITRPEAVNGMAPFAHAEATVIKLHGDYKDLGTRNTPEELDDYPDEWNTLLRQVFDEYGLIISGWSADWDTALVNALETSPNRRYPLYWDSRSSKSGTAQRVLGYRKGLVIRGAGADELFDDLVASVDALERLSQPPLTTAMAVARVKRYLPDPVHRIDLHDLVMNAANEVADHIAAQPLNGLDAAQAQGIYEGYREAVAPLIHMLTTGVWHDQDGIHDSLWIDVLQRLVDAGTTPISSAIRWLDHARLWPGLLAMTAMGVASVRRDREPLIIRLATEVRGRGRMGTADPTEAAQLMHPNRVLAADLVNNMPRWEGQRWLYPASHLLKADIRRFFEPFIPLDADYVEAFHGYEYRLGLIQEHSKGLGRYRALSGEYAHEDRWSHEGVPFAEVAFRQAGERSRDWPWPALLQTEDLDIVLTQHREVLAHYRDRF